MWLRKLGFQFPPTNCRFFGDFLPFFENLPSETSPKGNTSTSNEKNPGWLGYVGDDTTQLYRDYNTPLWGSLKTNQDSTESNKVFVFFPGSLRFRKMLRRSLRFFLFTRWLCAFDWGLPISIFTPSWGLRNPGWDGNIGRGGSSMEWTCLLDIKENVCAWIYIINSYPEDPCMVYLPTFGWFLW